MILTELLWFEHPLEFNDAVYIYRPSKRDKLLVQTSPPVNGMLHPQILETCKQLYLEGSEILYSNTINCRVSEPFYRPDYGRLGNFILRQEYHAFAFKLPPAITQKISRVRVQLFAHHQREKRDPSLDSMEQGIEDLAREFRKIPAWKHIDIEVIHVYHPRKLERQSRNPADSISFASALHPWRYVRKRTAVTITGLNSKLISALPALMTCTKPFVDLALAYNTLKEYSRIVISPMARKRVPNPHLGTILAQTRICGRAVRHEDADLFIRSRKRMMVALNNMVIRQEAKVFQHDSSQWDTGPDLTASATDSGSQDLPEDDDQPLSDYNVDDVLDDEYTNAYEDSDEDDSDDSDSSDEDDWDSDGDPWGNGGGCECPHCANVDDSE